MKGQETFRFAVTAMTHDLKNLIAQAGFSEGDIDWVVPHQANIRIIDAAKKRLNIPPERFCVNIDRYGNTSAASIPMMMDELNRSGKLKRGDLMALCAFGVDYHSLCGCTDFFPRNIKPCFKHGYRWL